MKTKKIAKILGLGLVTALAFSLGASIIPTSADPMEWSTTTTPSWEDNLIELGSDIYDYAVGPDGDHIVAVGAVVSIVNVLFVDDVALFPALSATVLRLTVAVPSS